MLNVIVTATNITIKRGSVLIAEWGFLNGTLNPSDIPRIVEVSLSAEA